jgi:cytochrome c peroxidase
MKTKLASSFAFQATRCGQRIAQFLILVFAATLQACGGGGDSGAAAPPPPPPPPPLATVDQQLRTIISARGLTGDPSTGRNLPSINDPLAQLGKLLFFSKSLSGDFDTACASCHHPALGGGDGLSLPVGTGAIDPDLLGPGRERPDGLPNVGRHSQTVFNVGLYDGGLFWDSRIESINKDAGANGTMSGIRSPDVAVGAADSGIPVGATLPAAQARLPVTVAEEMRGTFMPGANDDALRTRLAERIGDYGAGQGDLANNGWLAEFQTAFASNESAQNLITFDNIAMAIGEYQRSMVFVDTPWKAYVEGNNSALSNDAKQGALLFFNETTGRRGFDCAKCHSGDFFTSEEQMLTGFPQIGPGKGDGASGNADFGREQQTANTSDRFLLRTPTLLNLRATAPYSHSGVYETLLDATGHYVIPEDTFSDFQARGGVCSLDQFSTNANCATIFPNVVSNSQAALNAVIQARTSAPDITFENTSSMPLSTAPQLLAFLNALTDPCTLDRTCLAPWVPEPSEAPDENQLNAIDGSGSPL